MKTERCNRAIGVTAGKAASHQVPGQTSACLRGANNALSSRTTSYGAFRRYAMMQARNPVVLESVMVFAERFREVLALLASKSPGTLEPRKIASDHRPIADRT